MHEHDRVDPALHDGLEIASRDPFELGTVDDAAFDHGHELGAGLLVDLDSCVKGVDGAPVRAARRGQRRRENSDAPVARLLYRGPRPRLDDPMIGTSNERCVALRAEAVAVLHAITISFTFMPMR